MMRRLVISILLCATLWPMSASPVQSRETNDAQPDTIWTAIIPEAFPRYIYTWRFRADGTYREDGRDAMTGTAIQQTLSGSWNREGTRMILRQADQPFVFDGAVLGDLYVGTLYFGGRAISPFCAAKGEQAPTRCASTAGIAALRPPKKYSQSLNPVVSNRNATHPA
jgi:hypothetical protein